jgi:hypothetical protein
MEVDAAWLIHSLPPAKRTSKKPPPRATMEVQLDWLEDEGANPRKRSRRPPAMPVVETAKAKRPPPLPASVAKPQKKLPPPLPREEPPESTRRR